jgi:hypothetical protein
VEKLDVEQVKDPTANTERYQGGQQSVSQKHIWRRKPSLDLLFSRLAAHRFVSKTVAKIGKKLYLCPIKNKRVYNDENNAFFIGFVGIDGYYGCCGSVLSEIWPAG